MNRPRCNVRWHWIIPNGLHCAPLDHPDLDRSTDRANRDRAVDRARAHSHEHVSDVCQLDDG